MEKLARLPSEVAQANPEMTLADEYRAIAAWRYWQKIRAKAFDLDGD